MRLSHVYKIKYLAKESAFANTCERRLVLKILKMNSSVCYTVLGCHPCSNSGNEISSLLDVPQSAVSAIITEWKLL